MTTNLQQQNFATELALDTVTNYVQYFDYSQPIVSLQEKLDTIIIGDCIAVMQSFPGASIDFVLTDPPYLVKYTDRNNRQVANDDNANWLLPAFREIYRVLKPNTICLSFYSWHKVDTFLAAWRAAGFYPIGHIVWAKDYASNKGFVHYTHESAYLLAKGNPTKPPSPINDVLPWHYTGNSLHPTQKPVMAISPLIQAFTQPGAVVLDPFCGSGTTAVAARLYGRWFIGIELEADYAYIAAQRLHNVQSIP